MESKLSTNKRDEKFKKQGFSKSNSDDKVHSLTEIIISQLLVSNIDLNHRYGQHECQESGGGEGSLHKHYKSCTKNPGHAKFIPVTSFNIQHLPEGHHDNDLYKLIKAIADLTVRIGVKMVSPHRQEFWSNTNVPYPFYDKRGTDTMRTGSGEIIVYKFEDGCGLDANGSSNNELGYKYVREYKNCPCEKCQHSDKHNNVWWEIFVYTATHVVFDNIEASHTSCRLFFDEKDSPKVSLNKFSVHYVNIEEDRCVVKYTTCDITMGNELYKMAVHRNDLWNKVVNKYRNRYDIKLNFIVSHPHGCSKQVSVGQWMVNKTISEYDKDYDRTRLTYTTCTCPGSSGARVYCVGFREADHVHSGTLGSILNYSNVGYYRE